MSSEAKNDGGDFQVCTICLTSQVTKIVGSCQHAFCTECLSKQLKSVGEDSKTFLCPTCKVEYPMPADGVSGLVDCSQDGQTMVKQAAEEANLQEKPSKCLSCFYRTKDSVQAKNICVDCGDMVLCDACTEVHHENKVTKYHAILPLDWSRRTEEVQCEAHGLCAKDYCSTCSKQVCCLCIQFDHGSHTVRKLHDIFLEVAKEVQATAREHRLKSSRLRHVGYELKMLKSSALNHRDTIVKKIEDEAEKRIEVILRNKEDLKQQVRNEFSFVDKVVTCVDTIPALVERLDETVADAEMLLAETAIGVAELEKITSLRDSMRTYDKLTDQIDDENLWNQYESLNQKHLDFLPDARELSMGTIFATKADISLCNLVHSHVSEEGVVADFISCVVIVGSKYAVAHPASADNLPGAIDIYAFPGAYERTLEEHVPSVYDMAKTPDCKLAILSDGTSDDACNIRIFDTETGYIRSSSDIKLRGHVAFDVTMRGQYVILSKVHRRYMLSVARDDGTVLVSQVITKKCIEDPKRISTMGKYCFVLGDGGFAVYEHRNEDVVYITTVRKGTNNINSNVTLTDISARCNGEITMSYNGHISHNWGFMRGNLKGSRVEKMTYNFGIGNKPDGADAVSRVSVSDNYIVASQGRVIRVYEEKGEKV